jgi:hypothetical protein
MPTTRAARAGLRAQPVQAQCAVRARCRAHRERRRCHLRRARRGGGHGRRQAPPPATNSACATTSEDPAAVDDDPHRTGSAAARRCTTPSGRRRWCADGHAGPPGHAGAGHAAATAVALAVLPAVHRQSEIGPDGHAKRGGFLPPVPLPRRMWAGSQFEFRAPVRVGDTVARTSTIDDVTVKEGRTGQLVFVKVRHDAALQRRGRPGDRRVPRHRLPRPEAARRRGPAAAGRAHRRAWQREIVPDDVLLFRYSALTFNGHRIHYDRPTSPRSRATRAWSCTAR